MSDFFKRNNENKIINFIFGGLAGILITIIIMFIFSAILLLLNLDRSYATPFATVSIGVGSFFSAFLISKKIGNKGYLNGLIIGGVTFVFITLLSLLLGNSLSLNTLFHFIIIFLSSLIGGIMGVNLKKNKKYI